MELPGEAQPGDTEVTCSYYPVPGQHPVHCTSCSSSTKQEFLGLKCARHALIWNSLVWIYTSQSRWPLHPQDTEIVGTQKNTWIQEHTGMVVLTCLFTNVLALCFSQHFIFLGTRLAKWWHVLGMEANQPSFGSGLCGLHWHGPSTVTQPPRTLKDRNRPNLHPVPAPKGQWAVKMEGQYGMSSH